MIRKLTQYMVNARGETLRYVIAGAFTTLINFSVFALMTKKMNIAVTLSNVTAITLSIIAAYVSNKLYVFRQRRDNRRDLILEFSKFVGSRFFTMGLEVGAVAFLVGVLGQKPLISKIEAQVIVVITNFFISKALVFTKLF